MKILSPRSGRNNLEYLKIMKVALVHDYFNLGGNWLKGQSNRSRLVDKSQASDIIRV